MYLAYPQNSLCIFEGMRRGCTFRRLPLSRLALNRMGASTCVEGALAASPARQHCSDWPPKLRSSSDTRMDAPDGAFEGDPALILRG